MLSFRPVQAIVLASALILGWSSSGLAQNAQKEVRDAHRNYCKYQSGNERGSCMRETARTMRDVMEIALSEYKKCISNGYETSYCNELRQNVLRSSLEY